jgi:hypothetical protein
MKERLVALHAPAEGLRAPALPTADPVDLFRLARHRQQYGWSQPSGRAQRGPGGRDTKNNGQVDAPNLPIGTLRLFRGLTFV